MPAKKTSKSKVVDAVEERTPKPTKPAKSSKTTKVGAPECSRFVNLLTEALRTNALLERHRIEVELMLGVEDAYATAGTLGAQFSYPETDDHCPADAQFLNGKKHVVIVNLESNDYLFEDTAAGMRALIGVEAHEAIVRKRKDAALRKLTQEEREALNMGHWVDPFRQAAKPNQ
jgi:hypothetical protein